MFALVGSLDYFDQSNLCDIVNITEWIELGQHKELYEAVSYHADMMCCSVGNKLVVAPTLYESLCRRYPKLKRHFIKGQTELRTAYPDNIAYNVAFIGKYAIHNTKYTDPILKKCVDAQGYEWIHTKQGYSNCMLLTTSSNSAITSDAGLAKCLMEKNIEVLLIEQGHIDLPGLSYGFIGGASFVIDNTIYLNGDLSHHPDKKRIKDFIEMKACQLVNLSGNQLLDFGSVRFLLEE